MGNSEGRRDLSGSSEALRMFNKLYESVGSCLEPVTYSESQSDFVRYVKRNIIQEMEDAAADLDHPYYGGAQEYLNRKTAMMCGYCSK